MTSLLQRFVNIRREEVAPILAAALYFFLVLTALGAVRPAREALGVQRGMDEVVWLFTGTAVVTLLVTPAFGFLVSRFRRLVFISANYLFFAASLLVFHALLVFTPLAIGERSGQVFYVWFSVFNLFVTMVFWALLADRFSSDQGKRFFALIAVGGTLGAIFGPWLAARLAGMLGTATLLLVASLFLALAIAAAWLLVRVRPDRAARDDAAPAVAPPVEEAMRIGGNAWAGLRAVFASPYLAGIAGYVLLMTVVATFIYFTRLQMVAAATDDLDAQTAMFGNIDMWTQIAVLLLQLTLTGRIIKRFGLGVALALLPLAMALGFLGLAIYGSFAVLILLEAANRAFQRGLTRPARETLYTVVSREDKYKSKAFIDTFVYRTGDVAGAQVDGLLARLGMGLAGIASVAVPLALAWAALALWLGRAQQHLAGERRPHEYAAAADSAAAGGQQAISQRSSP
jgi:ATP:ADP antiporter, AAA family